MGSIYGPEFGQRPTAANPIKLDFVPCSKLGCTAEAKLPANVVASMKTGRKLLL
jgi:invasion protein IalB